MPADTPKGPYRDLKDGLTCEVTTDTGSETWFMADCVDRLNSQHAEIERLREVGTPILPKVDPNDPEFQGKTGDPIKAFEESVATAGGGGFDEWYTDNFGKHPTTSNDVLSVAETQARIMYNRCEYAWNESARRSEAEITQLREAVRVLGGRVRMSVQSAHAVLGRVGETWEHFITDDILANPITSAAVREAKEQA